MVWTSVLHGIMAGVGWTAKTPVCVPDKSYYRMHLDGTVSGIYRLD